MVIETFLKGSANDISLCEDGFIVTDDYAVMIDGAGTPSSYDFHGVKGGRYIMKIIRDCIPYLEVDLNHITFLDKVNEFIINDYKANGWYDDLKCDVSIRPMASVLVYSRNKNELWFYGDCKALVNDVQIENNKFIDDVMMNARKMVIEGELHLGRSEEDLRLNDLGREYINTLLGYQRLFLHKRDGSELSFSSVDGFDFIPEKIKVVKLENDFEYLVMSTDGYSTLKPTLEETEAELKRQLSLDSLCVNDLLSFKTVQDGFNSFDDRAYIRLRFMG